MNYAMSLISLASVLLTLSQVAIVESAVSTDPCLTAVNIGNKRRSTAYVPSESDILLSDDNLTPSLWCRFDSSSGSKMPESCVDVFHCGTFGPVYMNGVHPTAANPGPKTVSVCAQLYSGNCCGWSSQISVKCCLNATTAKEYFVYQLQPTQQYSAYCAGDGVVCGLGQTWNSINSTCTNFSISMTNPTLGTPYVSAWKQVIASTGGTFNATKFSIDCNIGYAKKATDDGVRFKVSFQADGEAIANAIFTANSTNPVAVLDEHYLRGYLGKSITCSVQSYVEPYDSDQISRVFVSNGIWIGIRPEDTSGNPVTTAVLQQGQSFSFRMRATFPITHAHCFTTTSACRITYQFAIRAPNQNLFECSFGINSTLNPSDPIIVSPVTINIIKRNIVGRIVFNIVNDSFNTIFENYTIQGILVTIYDPSPQPYCYTWGDPHIYVFGSNSYYDTFASGNFYLLRNTARSFEIQVRQILCLDRNSKVSCNCGVIVREGNNILGINGCDYQTSPLVVNYLLDANFPPGTIEWIGDSWTINLISGIKIIAQKIPNNYGTIFLNIGIYGLNSETYDGLCAYTSTASTVESFRVPESQSFFGFSSNNLPKCVNISAYIPICNCTGKTNSGYSATCDQAGVLQMLPVFQTGIMCHSAFRRRRATSSNLDNIIDLDKINARINHTIDSLVYNVTLTWPTPSGITQQQARDQCNTVLRSSPAYQTCSAMIDLTSIINSCVVDIQLMDQLTAISYAAAIMVKSCIYTMKSNITETENGVSNDSVAMMNKINQVESTICPAQCSGNGNCSQQKCICKSGYFGDDCSIMQGQQPSVKGVISSYCDLQKSPCQTIYVEATGVLNSPNLICRIQPQGVCSGGQYAAAQTLNGSYTNYGPVLCSTLVSPVDHVLATGASIYVVNISISNDGVGWSNSVIYTVYDGSCITCDTNGCQKKTSIAPADAQHCTTSATYGTVCNFDSNNKCVPSSCSTVGTTSTSTTTRSTPSTSTSTSTTTTRPTTTTTTTTTTTPTTRQTAVPSTTTLPAMTDCWVTFENSNVPSGRLQPSALSLDQCKSQCLAARLTTCAFGFDFNPYNPPGDQCYFSTSNNILINNYPGVVHYVYGACNTVTIPVSRTTTLPTTTTPVSLGCWDISNNSNSPGGTVQPWYTTLLDCQVQCYQQASCIGFDWVPASPYNQRCWFSRSSSINYNTYPGCTHYQRKSC